MLIVYKAQIKSLVWAFLLNKCFLMKKIGVLLFCCSTILFSFFTCEEDYIENCIGLFVLNDTNTDIIIKTYVVNDAFISCKQQKRILGKANIDTPIYLKDVLSEIDSCSLYKIENNDTIRIKTWYSNEDTNLTNNSFYMENKWKLFSRVSDPYEPEDQYLFVITETDLITKNQ